MTDYNRAGWREAAVVLSEKCPSRTSLDSDRPSGSSTAIGPLLLWAGPTKPGTGHDFSSRLSFSLAHSQRPALLDSLCCRVNTTRQVGTPWPESSIRSMMTWSSASGLSAGATTSLPLFPGCWLGIVEQSER